MQVFYRRRYLFLRGQDHGISLSAPIILEYRSLGLSQKEGELCLKKITTINFEGNEIRFLVVKGDDIRSWHTLKIPPEYMVQGQISKPPRSETVISKTIKKLKGSRRNVITSVTGQRSLHRIMTIPNMQDKLLEETIRRKTKQEFAIPLDETDIHWRILSRSDSQLILYVLAVPKNHH